MLAALKIFCDTRGANKWAVLACILFAVVLQGIGMASLVPLIAVVVDSQDTDTSAASRMVLEGLDFLGIPSSLSVLLLIVTLSISAKSGLNLLAMRFVGYAVADVTTLWRKRLVESLLNADWAFFSNQSLGRLVNVLGPIAQRAGTAFSLSAEFISSSLQCFVYIVVALLVSWKLALFSVIIGAVITVSLHRFVKRAREAGRDDASEGNVLGAVVADALLGIKSLKAMDRQEEYAKLLAKSIDRMRKTMRRRVLSKEKLTNYQSALQIYFMAGAFYFLIEVANVPVSEVLVMGVLLLRTVKTVSRLQSSLQQVAIVEGSYEEITKIMATTERHREPHSGTLQPSMDQGIEFKDISFKYPRTRHVLKNVSLDIPANQLTVLIGPSGAGKTTLVDLLLGFHQPSSGKILIDGVPLSNLDIHAWRRMTGYVAQELTLFTDSVLANVTLRSPAISEEAAIEALKAAEIWDFVSSLPSGIHTLVGERGSKLSGGERQRIALARALILKPKLLILDEASSALDPETEIAICESVRRLSEGITIVAISHKEAWRNYADQIYRIENGQVFSAAQTLDDKREPA